MKEYPDTYLNTEECLLIGALVLNFLKKKMKNNLMHQGMIYSDD